MYVTAFFVPESTTNGTDAEEAYSRIRKAAEVGRDCPAREQRIFKLAFRHHGIDLEAEVGRPDPVGGAPCWRSSTLGGNRPT